MALASVVELKSSILVGKAKPPRRLMGASATLSLRRAVSSVMTGQVR